MTKTVQISQAAADYIGALQAEARRAQGMVDAALTGLLREKGIVGAVQITAMNDTTITVEVPE